MRSGSTLGSASHLLFPLIRDAKRASCPKFTPEEQTRIVLGSFQGDTPIRDLCRRACFGLSRHCFWLNDFIDGGRERPIRDAARDAIRAEAGDFKRENARRGRLAAELSTQAHGCKNTALPGLEQ